MIVYKKKAMKKLIGKVHEIKFDYESVFDGIKSEDKICKGLFSKYVENGKYEEKYRKIMNAL